MARQFVFVMIAAAFVTAAGACGNDRAGSSVPAWDKSPPDSSVAGERRGLTPARAIVHLHSVYSHDACDGKPRENEIGAIDEDCLSDLRDALCRARIDVVALTDHDGSLANEEWGPTLFLFRDGDQLVEDDDGNVVASVLTCDDGHQTLLRVGSESETMPLFMESHPEAGSLSELQDIYNGTDKAAADALRAAGATLWVAHTESKTAEWIEAIDAAGLEIYNFHAAVDPDIRRDYLGLDSTGGIEDALEFNRDSDDPPEIDLAGMALMFPNEPALATWKSLLAKGRHVPATVGTDAHQNALPMKGSDGERLDSYRRMMRWASNFMLLRDPRSPTEVESTLAAGRSFVAFEVFGTPAGFDFYGQSAGGTLEMGDEAQASADLQIVAVTPQVANLWDGAPPPIVETVVYRIDAGGEVEVARGSETLTVTADQPGAYRAEVSITPAHLAPYLGELGDYATRTYTWVYSNPIYVTP